MAIIFGRNNETIKKYAPKMKNKSFKILKDPPIKLNLLIVKNTMITNKLNTIAVNKLICKELSPKILLDKIHTKDINKKHEYDNKSIFLKLFLKLFSLDNKYPIKIKTNAIRKIKL